MPPRGSRQLEAQLRQAATSTSVEYASLRDRAIAEGAVPEGAAAAGVSLLPALERLVRSADAAISLTARAWRGWIAYADVYRTVMRSFALEEATAPELISPREPSALELGSHIARFGGPRVVPLLGEILWKTGERWSVWRRQACLVALERLGPAAAAETLADLFVVTAGQDVRDKALALARRTDWSPLRQRLLDGRGGIADPVDRQLVDELAVTA
jgi:hypothetical protein